MPEALKIESVSKRYNQGKYIIRDFSYTFEPGTATALTGPNGSGKTTLLRLITTTAFPTSGHIFYGDIDIHKNPHQYLSHTGFAFESGDLPQFANTNELLEAMLRSRNMWDEGSPAEINELLKMLELDDRRENLIGTYSSGMMQKTLIAATLVTNPDLIILDEPFRALDTETRDTLTSYLLKQKQSGKTIIIASHLPEIIEKLCDKTLGFPLDGD